MNIIIFSKRTTEEDADGEHGPHVWWYQEEVNPRRRERYLVSPTLAFYKIHTNQCWDI